MLMPNGGSDAENGLNSFHMHDEFHSREAISASFTPDKRLCDNGRTGSFTDTARELFLTHSAMSHSVRALENEFGCILLNRLGKRIELAAAGESF
jgi:hypothetical protein